MLSKCANPACPAPFLYLHEGKIFNIEVEVPSAPYASEYVLNGRARKLEHYWLCDNCLRSMTVVLEHGKVIARLAHRALAPWRPQHASAHAD